MIDTDLVDRVVARARELSQVQAALLADLVAVADVTPNPEFVAFEISTALTWTRQAATTQLDLAHTIVRSFPLVHAAMMAGELDFPKARVIADGVVTLDLDLARTIVAAILPQAPALNTSELRTQLAKLVIQADPNAAAKRHKARVRGRRVELQPAEDSCATLLGLNLPADDALAASNRLTAFARALKRVGDPRSVDQLRADTFLNLLLGNTCGQHAHPGNYHSGNGLTGDSSARNGSTGSGSTGSGPTRSGSTGNGVASGGSTGGGLSGNGLSGNGLSGNGLSGNGLSGNGLSGNGLSGNGLSGNRVATA